MDGQPSIAEVLAEAARTMNAPRTLDETLDAIVHGVRRTLPEMDHVGISIAHRGGRIETKAATTDLVWHLDAVQYDLHEGPCVHAMEAGPAVVVEHARQEQRWPRYIPKAVQAGLRSQLGLQLFVDERTLGGLNMYSTSSDTIDPESVHHAALFATHAALALGRARREEDLNAAIGSRKLIGQAIGLTMARFEIDEDRAFDFMLRASQQSNIKLRDIAQEIVDTANQQTRKIPKT